MDQWLMVLSATVGVFLVVVVGWVARRTELLTPAADASLLKLIVRVLLPCLILDKVMVNEHLRSAEQVLWPPVVGFGTVVAGFFLALLVAKKCGKWIGLTDPKEQRTFAFCVGMFNYGFIPIPLIERLYTNPEEQTATLGVLFVHNIAGVEIALWTVGIVLLTGGLTGRWWLRLLSPPGIAIAGAMLLNFSGLGELAPGAVRFAIQSLGVVCIPLALLLVGTAIADQLKGANLLRHGGVIAGACSLRLALLPAAFLLLAAALPVSTELKRVMVFEAAMPSAVFPIVLARHYGGDVRTAVRVVVGTSLVSLITMPLWIGTGFWLLGRGIAPGSP